MLEILLLGFFCKKLSAIARSKGRGPAGYCLMLVGLWIFGEIAGFVLAMILSNSASDFNPLAYLTGIAGAAGGAIITFVFTNSRSSLIMPQEVTHGFPVIQRPPNFPQ